VYLDRLERRAAHRSIPTLWARTPSRRVPLLRRIKLHWWRRALRWRRDGAVQLGMEV